MVHLKQKLLRLEARREHLARRLWIVENKICDIRYPGAAVETNGPGLYILRCGSLFKVGYATDFASRLTSLQIGNPYDLILINFIKCESAQAAEYLESILHKRFDGKNTRVEWYRLTDLDLAEIEQLRSEYCYESLFAFNSEKNIIKSPFRTESARVESEIIDLIRNNSTRAGMNTSDLISIAANGRDIPEKVTIEIIRKLKRDGEVYEPRPNVIKLP